MDGVPLVITSNAFSNMTNIVLCTVLCCVGGGQLTKKTLVLVIASRIARFMGPTWGPSRANRTQVGPMFASGTLLSGLVGISYKPVHEQALQRPIMTPLDHIDIQSYN